MSTLGKVLAVLNVLAAIGFLVVAGMDYNKRQSWAYSHFRHQLAVYGLPVDRDDDTWRLPGRTISNDLSKRTLDDLFSPGGDAVQTQVEAVEHINSQILGGAADKADDQAKKIYFAGYLVPLALWAERSGERAVVATHTVNLQEQLADRDLPSVAGITHKPLAVALLKGRNHYISLRRWERIG